MDFTNQCSKDVKNNYPDYNVTISQTGTIECHDELNSCQHAYCMCHKQFVESFPEKIAGEKEHLKVNFTKERRVRKKHLENLQEGGSAPTLKIGRSRRDAQVDPKKSKKSKKEKTKNSVIIIPSQKSNICIPPNRANPTSENLNMFGHFKSTNPLKPKRKKPSQCCGVYPFRYPYAEDESHKCCGNKTYNLEFSGCCEGDERSRVFNKFTQVCCGDRVREVGSC